MTYRAVVASRNDADVDLAEPGWVAFRLMPKIHPCPRYAEPVQPEARRLHPYYFKRLKEQK